MVEYSTRFRGQKGTLVATLCTLTYEKTSPSFDSAGLSTDLLARTIPS